MTINNLLNKQFYETNKPLKGLSSCTRTILMNSEKFIIHFMRREVAGKFCPNLKIKTETQFGFRIVV